MKMYENVPFDTMYFDFAKAYDRTTQGAETFHAFKVIHLII